MKPKILIADDEPDIVAFMIDALEDDGYDVLVAYDGAQVFEQLGARPDLIILDVMMPHMDGFEVARTIRDRVGCPILFLSARGAEDDRIQGLMAGGDDYLVKPVSMRELKARVAAHLRREQRAGARPERHVVYDGIAALDASNYKLYVREKPVSLTPREFEIVQFLMSHPGQVFHRDVIYDRIWGFDAEGDSATVTEHIKKIRAKLAEAAQDHTFIATVWGVGYKWEPAKT